MLLDAHTKQEIPRCTPFSSEFRPNWAIIMMIIYPEPEGIRRCPRCSATHQSKKTNSFIGKSPFIISRLLMITIEKRLQHAVYAALKTPN